MRYIRAGMHTSRRLIAAIGFAAAAHAQQPMPMDAFGFTFGRPLALPECAKQPFGAMYAASTRVACVQLSKADAQAVTIQVPYSERPGISKSHLIGARLDAAGNLALLVVTTPGITTQDAAFSELVSKYGQPTSSDSVPLVNATGGRFDAVVAAWRSPTLEVQFYGMVSSNTGQIIIGRPAAIAEREAKAEALKQSGRKL